ncbi:MAG: Asp23/Gls24 family envelope stress response protein [Candidatus Omnitrophota bacterium]
MRPENKVDLGVIAVHTNVIADICSAAVADIDGVTLAHKEQLEALASMVGIRLNTSVDVIVEPSGQVSVIVKVLVRYGMNLPETSRRIQDAVMTAVEKMADINLRDVDVSIRGINRGAA